MERKQSIEVKLLSIEESTLRIDQSEKVGATQTICLANEMGCLHRLDAKGNDKGIQLLAAKLHLADRTFEFGLDERFSGGEGIAGQSVFGTRRCEVALVAVKNW